MIDNLVANGCSYMYTYADGGGHEDLAERLNISQSSSIAVSGSANSRILRTTLKHSQTAPPTLYVLGLTFVSRWEVPILHGDNEFEGRWCNPQNQDVKKRWQPEWTQKDSDKLIEIKLKSEIYSVLDRVEDLMYRIIAVIDSLKAKGHRVIVFQTADNLHLAHMDHPRLKYFDRPEIVHGYQWRAITWQDQQGVPPLEHYHDSTIVPRDVQHRALGHHQILNQYLTEYIKEHTLLQ